MSEEPELHPHPATAPFGMRDRDLLLAMSKSIVAIGQQNNASKWAAELAMEQYKYRQRFFPETIEP